MTTEPRGDLQLAAELQQPNAAESLLQQALAQDDTDLAQAVHDRARARFDETGGAGWARVVRRARDASLTIPVIEDQAAAHRDRVDAR